MLATLSTEMLVCNESFSVPCWTREEATLYLRDRSDRGHGSLSEQAVTILQWMNFYWLNPWDQQLAWIFLLLLLWLPNFSCSQNSWTKTLPGNCSNVFGRCDDYYFIHFLLHVSGFCQTKRIYGQGRCRSQTPTQFCWTRVFRYLGCDPSKYSRVGFKRFGHSALSQPHKDGHNQIGPIGYPCPPGVAGMP